MLILHKSIDQMLGSVAASSLAIKAVKEGVHGLGYKTFCTAFCYTHEIFNYFYNQLLRQATQLQRAADLHFSYSTYMHKTQSENSFLLPWI